MYSEGSSSGGRALRMLAMVGLVVVAHLVAQLFYARRTLWLWPASFGCSVTPTQSPTVRVPTQSGS